MENARGWGYLVMGDLVEKVVLSGVGVALAVLVAIIAFLITEALHKDKD